MPANIIKSFAEKANKSEQEVEKRFKEAKALTTEQYGLTEKDEDKFYALAVGILKKMLNIADSLRVNVCICENCRGVVSDSASFCSSCGSMLSDKGLMDNMTLQELEKHFYENEDEIRENMETYGFKVKDIKNVRNYIDFANILGVDSRDVRNVELRSYAATLYELLRQ